MGKSVIKKIKAYNQKSRSEYKAEMSDLLKHEKLKLLDEYKQHYKCTRLKHSVDVSYYSFYVAKLLGLDYISTARAGLLHDLYFHETSGIRDKIKMIRQHPKDALKNAQSICALNEMESDIIIRHMWFLTFKPPKYKEGHIVSFVDKYCAVKEIFSSVFSKNFVRKSNSRMKRFYELLNPCYNIYPKIFHFNISQTIFKQFSNNRPL
jgi:uncharacterized protein